MFSWRNNKDATILKSRYDKKDVFYQENKKNKKEQWKEQFEISLARLRCLKAATKFNHETPFVKETENVPIKKLSGKGKDICVKTRKAPQRLILICEKI